MKISKIGVAMHELGRAREIIGILVKYGFQEWVSNNGFGRFLVSRKRLANIERFNRYERTRMAFEELGPTFIKFGQIVADRPDVFSEELRAELRKLQDEAIPMPDDLAIAEIEKNLGQPISGIFKEFDRNHLASASIAQTYRAVLLNGDEVCVKIQRPGIRKKIDLDLNLMEFFASRAQKTNPEMEAINLTGVIKEFGKTIHKEMDFRHEAGNVIRFRHNFEGDPDIYVPQVYMEYSKEHILVEEFIDGIKISELVKLRETGLNLEELARKAIRLVFEQIFNHGFFHADPHPGNLFLNKNQTLTFLDYGMMGSLRPEHLGFLGKYVLGYLSRDAHDMTEALLLLSGKRTFSRVKDLEFQIQEMLAHYRYLTVDQMHFGKVMNESVDIIVHFGLRIPPSIYLLVKSLMTIERVAVTLYPEIDFAQEMQPYALDLIRRQFSPKQIAMEVFEALKDYYKLIRELPAEINEILSRIKEGQFKTQIEVKGLEPLNEHIDLASSRIATSIVIASLIVGASIISQWEQLRWVGSVVFMLAGLLGFWLLIRLFRRNKY
ncbi:MAG TPA: AarF/ABC1/UbiB kinase family protein [Bacteroidales bacterium]|nr:AarF/ABC1/UbiB kinase family protein [Bacteroidales bacterium]